MNPTLRQLTGVVEPHRYRGGTRPRHVRRQRRRNLVVDGVGGLLIRPSEQIDDKTGAKSPSGMNPLDLEIIEPADEPQLIQLCWCRRPVMVVSLPGEEAQIVTKEVDAECEYAPTRTRARPSPARWVETTKHLQQARPLELEQRGKCSWTLGGHGHSLSLADGQVAAPHNAVAATTLGGQSASVSSDAELARPIYHLALRDEWQAAVEGNEPYRRSTLGRSLDDEGFIHCSFADQVTMIADLIYRGRPDVLLLVIDPSRLQAEVRVENLEGGGQLFPHIYGALPVEAVLRADQVPLGDDGSLAVGMLLASD